MFVGAQPNYKTDTVAYTWEGQDPDLRNRWESLIAFYSRPWPDSQQTTTAK